jgi:hypothetical protein
LDSRCGLDRPQERESTRGEQEQREDRQNRSMIPPFLALLIDLAVRGVKVLARFAEASFPFQGIPLQEGCRTASNVFALAAAEWRTEIPAR